MKIKEIEERWDYPNADKLDWNNAKDDIDSLLSECKRLEARVKEFEERQRWINEVARPDHPDDERPWCSAYLDCMERIKELEDGIEEVINLHIEEFDGDIGMFVFSTLACNLKDKLYKLRSKGLRNK